jgi:hypothetical protein
MLDCFYPEFVTKLTSYNARQIAGTSARLYAYTEPADNQKV